MGVGTAILHPLLVLMTSKSSKYSGGIPPDKENNLSSSKLWGDCGVLGYYDVPLYLPMKALKDLSVISLRSLVTKSTTTITSTIQT